MHFCDVVSGRASQRRPGPASGILTMDLVQDVADIVRQIPFRVMSLELRDVTDPPDVISDAIGLLICPVQSSSGNLLANIDRFEH